MPRGRRAPARFAGGWSGTGGAESSWWGRVSRGSGGGAAGARGTYCVLVDRERPGLGSTAASTAMLLWEIDRHLASLTELHGFDRAARAFRASLQAVSGLKSLIAGRQIACLLRERHSLYLAAGSIDGLGAAGRAQSPRAGRLAGAIHRLSHPPLGIRHRPRSGPAVTGLGRRGSCVPFTCAYRSGDQRRSRFVRHQRDRVSQWPTRYSRGHGRRACD